MTKSVTLSLEGLYHPFIDFARKQPGSQKFGAAPSPLPVVANRFFSQHIADFMAQPGSAVKPEVCLYIKIRSIR
jgi:hypothetical protein